MSLQGFGKKTSWIHPIWPGQSGCILLLLVLILVITNPVLEIRRGKIYLGRPRSSSGSKVVLILLTEVVAVHVRLSAIYVQKMGLQLIPGRFTDGGNQGRSESKGKSLNFWNSLNNPLQVTLGILGDINRSDKGNSKGMISFWKFNGLFRKFWFRV